MEKEYETWESIKGYEGLYCISNHGRVLSLKQGWKGRTRILKCETNHKGYKRVSLYKHGKKKNKRICRLVGEHFIENPMDKPQVNHKDGDKANDYYENLEWATCSENMQHAYALGLR